MAGDSRDRPGSSASGLSHTRTVCLAALLVLVFTVAIVAVCAVVAAAGLILIQSGTMTFEQLTAPATVVAMILLVSLCLSVIMCVAVNRTLVKPLRQMTQAMGRLASGDFAHRVEPRGRFLLREVGEFARSYNVAATELAGTEMLRAGFISDFSHEFRTPIASLSGFAQLLLEEDLPRDEQREYLTIIHEEAQRLAGLSERILALSKIEAASILPQVEPVDVAEQLRRAVALLDRRLAAKDLSVDLSLDPCTLPGNADYLAQLWTNLLDNAIKFSPSGARVSVALYGGRAGEEGRASSEDAAVVWVSDEGCGMDEATQARIFDRFYQADTSHACQGSGLGLALCKRIADLHGGSISVHSAPGKGSVFEVRLPLERHGD